MIIELRKIINKKIEKACSLCIKSPYSNAFADSEPIHGISLIKVHEILLAFDYYPNFSFSHPTHLLTPSLVIIRGSIQTISVVQSISPTALPSTPLLTETPQRVAYARIQ
jgi:hypothetical protein